MDETDLEITFLRHGRSRADDEAAHEGRYDSPLTEVGRRQAKQRAAGWLARGLGFDRIIASPLLRARETAEIVSATLAVPLEIDPDWMEMDNGPLAGLPWAEAAARYPPPVFRNPYTPFCGSGESDWECYCRAARAVEKVVRRGPGRYLVVSHGGILNDCLRGLAGAGPMVNRTGLHFAFSDTGYARFLYRPEKHQWALLEFSG